MTQPISGCFYLDSSIVFSEVLEQNKPRMDKFKGDVNNHNITCLVSTSVIEECQGKIEKTTDFLGSTLKDVLVAYLEGIRTTPRDLSSTKPSNEDLHVLQEAFLTVKQTAREFDLISDPFQAIEEWVVSKLDKEIEKPKGSFLSDFVLALTGTILKEINSLQSDFERLVELEDDYITQSDQKTDAGTIDTLVGIGVHRPDADHISVIESHRRNKGGKAIFLTFDYKSILLKSGKIRKVNNIECCDPIYGLSYLR